MRRAEILDRERTALGDYLDADPSPSDREAASYEIVKETAAYKTDWRFWGGDAPLVIESVERYLEELPDGEHPAEVSLLRGIATWKAWDVETEQTRLPGRSTSTAFPRRSGSIERVASVLLDSEARL